MRVGTSAFVALALIAAAVGATALVRRLQERKLVRLLGEGRFEELFRASEGFLCRATVPAFNLAYLRVNGFLMQGDDDRAEELLESLLAWRASRAQHEDVAMKAFRFYVERGERLRAEELYAEVSSFKDAAVRHEAALLKETFLDKGFAHIGELLQEVESAREPACLFNACYLLAAQYANKGEKELAHIYEERAAEALSGGAAQATEREGER